MCAGHRYLSAVIATLLLMVAPACAARVSYQSQYPAPQYPVPPEAIGARAYQRGYVEGRTHGERDRLNGRKFDYARHNDYRDADDGYQFGDRREYRGEFRRGFVDGYGIGYRSYASAATAPASGPAYARGGYTNTAAWQNGYRDGYDQGRKDARDGDRFDPIRSSRYRSGDHDYDRQYGSRDLYKRQYREAFNQGYDRGYRERR